MTFVVSAAHQTAVEQAVEDAYRLMVIDARFDLLTTPATPPTIEFYANPIPNPWDSGLPDPAPPSVVTMTMAAGVGTVDEALFQIQFAAPIEAQVTGADPSTGTVVTWAAIYDGDGALWGYGTVSNEAGSGNFKLQTTTLLQGSFARLTSLTVQG